MGKGLGDIGGGGGERLGQRVVAQRGKDALILGGGVGKRGRR